jgi:hypothetical protein
MQTKAWLVGGIAAALYVLGIAEGCQDAATCDSICALPDAPMGLGDTCSSGCGMGQKSADAAGTGGDFQALLTCVQNAGTYAAVSGICAAEAATVRTDSKYELPSASGTADAGATFDAGVPIEVDAGGITVESCVLRGPCETPGITCTLAAAGPCGSDERLVCAVDTTNPDSPSHETIWSLDGFPCDSASSIGCGFGSTGNPGCSESCGCQDGLEVCTGDCADGGPANP